MEEMRDDRTGVLLAVGSGLAFGTVAIFAKLAYDKGAQAVPLLTGRFLVATLLLIGWCFVTGRSVRIARSARNKMMLLGALGYAFEASLFFAALERAPAAIVGLIFYSYPLWTTLAGFALRIEPFARRIVIALVLGSAGVVTVFSQGTDGGGVRGSLGLWLALAAAVAVAAYFTLAQLAMEGVDPYAGAVWTSVGATIALITVTAASRAPLPVDAWAEVCALGVATALAYILLYRALVLIGSTRVSIAMMVEPVATLLLAALILDEDITIRVAVGAVLVISALPILASVRRKSLPAEI